MGLIESVRSALIPAKPVSGEVIEPTKAVTGRGAWVMEHHVPLHSFNRSGPKWMKRAQEISRTNPWIDRAERVISGRGASVPFHLEDANGDTVEDGAPDAMQAVLKFFERPNPRMTRRQLWSITLRHMGVCNHAFWYLDQRDALAGTPLAAYYINPARMTAARDRAGNITGWVLDAESEYEWGMGTPLQLDEVLHFELEPSDWPELSGGLVEAAEVKAYLSGAADKFATHTLTSGGRRGHFIAPSDGRMDDDVFDALVAGLRNVAESPEAAKRNIVVKGPIEATPQASTPRELEASAVMSLTRDDILALWNCPPSQIGVPAPAGLNSGSTKSYDEAALWQNAISPRLDAFTETVQYQLLDRWAELGLELQMVTDRPEFDDRAPAFELFMKSLDAPMRNKERRALLGLDPTGDERFDNEIWMPARLSPVVAINDDGKVIEDPEPTPPLSSVPGEEGLVPPPVEGSPVLRAINGGKATVRSSPLARLRSTSERRVVPALKSSVAKTLAEMKGDVVKRLRANAAHLARKPDDIDAWWKEDKWQQALRRALTPRARALAVEVARGARGVLSPPHKADGDAFDLIEQFVADRSGERITGMNETTRTAVLDAIRPVLAEAGRITGGTAPGELADRLAEAVEPLAVWDEARAEMIARTETMLAYNDAALRSFQELGATHVEAIDGDDDEECATRDGQRFSIEEALGITDHPNGTLDWLPVVGDEPQAEEATEEPAAEGQPTEFESGEQAHEYAHDAYAEWREGLTEDEAYTLKVYESSGYRDFNSMLRAGDVTDDVQAEIDVIDRTLQRATLDRDVVAYRGLSADVFGAENLTGATFSDAAYVSTSLDPAAGAKFLRYAQEDGAAALMRITVPEGTHAAYLEGLLNLKEYELLLPRGSTFQITADRVVDGVRLIDARVIG